jgi:hypothetical protein
MANDNSKDKDKDKQEQKAREKARELIQDAGKNLSAKEAERIERKTDVPIEKVVKIAERQNVNVPQRVENKVQTIVEQRTAQTNNNNAGGGNAAPAGNTGGSGVSNDLSRFRGQAGGFGLGSYQQAVNAGYTPAEILRLLPGSGLTVGEKARTQLDQDWKSITDQATNAKTYATLAEDYKNQLTEYSSTFNQLTAQYNDALAKQQGSAAQAAAEKRRADDLEKQRKDEQEIQVGQQLNSLRGGYTASGGSGSGLGSLSSGTPTRSFSTGARSGGVLSEVYKDIDPTDSVLDRDVVVSATQQVQGGGEARSQARQRALASGESAGQYYSRRFG